MLVLRRAWQLWRARLFFCAAVALVWPPEGRAGVPDDRSLPEEHTGQPGEEAKAAIAYLTAASLPAGCLPTLSDELEKLPMRPIGRDALENNFLPSSYGNSLPDLTGIGWFRECCN